MNIDRIDEREQQLTQARETAAVANTRHLYGYGAHFRAEPPDSPLPVVYPLAATQTVRWVYVKRCEMPGCFTLAQARWFGSHSHGEIHVYDRFCHAHERAGYLATLPTLDYTTPHGRQTYDEVMNLVEELGKEPEGTA